MKIVLKYCLYILFFCGVLSCNSSKREVDSYEGFPLEVTDDYKKVWAGESSNNTGTYYVYKLKKPKVIQSHPVKGRFSINSEGILNDFTFAEDHVFNGTLIPKGSWYEQGIGGAGYGIAISRDITIQDIPVTHKSRFLSEYFVTFHQDGTLLGFRLAEDMSIDKIPCNGTGKNREVMLYHNGNLRFCHLSENIKIHDVPCQGGEKNNNLWLSQDRHILSCILSEDIEFGGKTYTKGTTMIFDKERKVHFLTGQVSEVAFYETGQVFTCDITNDLEIDGKSIPAGSKIVFTETGAIDFFRP